MIFLKKPQGFSPKFEVVGCFCQNSNNMLLLKRHELRPQGGTFCVPGGKIDSGETPLVAVQREVKEETGIEITADKLMYVGAVFVKYPEEDMIFHMFKTIMTNEQANAVVLKADEHTEYKWLPPEEALQEKLIPDGDACIKICFSL